MDKQKALKIGGIAGIALSCIAFYLGGGDGVGAAEITGGVFALIAIVAGLLK